MFDNDSIRRILHVRRWDYVPTAELRHRLRHTSIPAQLAQRRPRWFGHAARRPEGELINIGSHVAQANWRPTEDVGNHDQDRPGAPLWTASLRLHTMEKGLDESLQRVCAGPSSLE